MNAAEDSSAKEVMYSRKPLTFILPALRESQALKNPFAPFLKTCGTSRSFNNATLPRPLELPQEKKAHSLTPTQMRRARIEMEKVPKPSLFVSEPLDTDPDCEEDSKAVVAVVKEQPATQPAVAVASPVSSAAAPCLMKKSQTMRETIRSESREEVKTRDRDMLKEMFKAKINGNGERDKTYELKLTKEVLHNFRQIEHIGFIPMEEVAKKYAALPEIKGKESNKTLLLDLDDTLVHTLDPKLNYSSIAMDGAAIKSALYLDKGTESLISMRVVIRPNAVKFLKELSPIYEIVIFTAGLRPYAQALLSLLDPKDQFIDCKIFRDKCISKAGHYIKDLRIFRNREMRNLIMVDNSIVSFSNNLDNGIHIPTFFGARTDNELMKLLPLLKSLAHVENVQTELKKRVRVSSAYAEHLKPRRKYTDGP